MSNTENKLYDQYGTVYLTYEVTDSDVKKNAENLELMKAALAKVGFSLTLDHNILGIYMKIHDYATTTTRNAGRRKSLTRVNDNFLRYSDVILMMQTMTDKEISEKIHMKIATYYRHKKAMKESRYFSSLDKNKLDDMEYLKSVKGDLIF